MLCHLNDVADGDARGFQTGSLRCKIIVVRKGDAVIGWRDMCPHYAGGTPMAWKRDAYLNGARSHLACHAHGAWFDMETGVCVQGPCLGKRLTRVRLKVDDNGGVHLDGSPGRKEEWPQRDES
jgi:nitrite reductase/ring-hydroxylating ferredoxin subunit